ncbi:hypothetical protein HPP92_013368 [Vanilla planifolia]|uniref:Golgin candidate 2 n=1 Tax=Vanilla planifolia TaxID=51239 RepID=A0A835UWE4_VANPL|nr:hypothetical protein HPP92_013368 [Vanilla planifolia]
MAGWISSKLKVAENLLQQIDQQAAESLGKTEKPRRSPSASDLASVTSKLNQPPRAGESSPLPPKFPLIKKSVTSHSSSTPSPQDLPKVSNTSSPSFSTEPAKSYPDPTIIDWTELLSSSSQTLPTTALRAIDGGSVRPPQRRIVKKLTIKKNGGGLSGRLTTPSSPSSSSSFPTFYPAKDNGGGDCEPDQGGSEKSHLPSVEVQEVINVGKHEISADVNGWNDESIMRNPDFLLDASGNFSSVRDRISDSDMDSSSSGSVSEEEKERAEDRRKQREHILAEKVARAAAMAIKEKEEIVARLEGEKMVQEKILEERKKQQAKEASELQMSMIETMEAVELEKQKHNSTRMEALARLAELEAKNAELAKSLAAEQWYLDLEQNQLAELKLKIWLKQQVHEELMRKMLKIQQQSSSQSTLESLRKESVEREILGAEYSFTCDKIAILKDKAKMLQESIEKTKRDIMQPTQLELELKKRLIQLTDRLIQKQAHVEALSFEKATLVIRIETISKLLDEYGLSLKDGELISADIESGTWEHSDYVTKATVRKRIRSGRQQFGLLVRQLDSIFSAGVLFLRRKPMARWFSVFYILCVHLWFFYILRSQSHVSDGTSQGAVLSLQTINNSSGY